jgi:hypothetical protein
MKRMYERIGLKVELEVFTYRDWVQKILTPSDERTQKKDWNVSVCYNNDSYGHSGSAHLVYPYLEASGVRWTEYDRVPLMTPSTTSTSTSKGLKRRLNCLPTMPLKPSFTGQKAFPEESIKSLSMRSYGLLFYEKTKLMSPSSNSRSLPAPFLIRTSMNNNQNLSKWRWHENKNRSRNSVGNLASGLKT